MENVSLTISKEIVNPIVQAKINEAILAAMGGTNNLIEKSIQTILYQKVDDNGRVSSYQHDNKNNWIDVVITNQIKEAVKEAMKDLLSEKKEEIKQAIIKQMSSKKAIESFAASLLSNASKVSEHYSSTVTVEFSQK